MASASQAHGAAAPHVMRGIVCAALGGICWGFSGTCAQLLTSEYGIPVAWITPVRLTAGAIIFLLVCGFKNWRSLRAALRDLKSLAAIAGFALLGVLLTQASYLSAIAYTNAGIGTVLERLGLIVILAYVCISVRRFPSRREWLGLLLAMGGVFLIATQGNLGALAIPIQGLLWGIVSAFSLAFYSILPVKPLAKWGSFIVTGLAMLIAAAVSLVAVRPWTMNVEVTPEVVGIMALMVVIGTFGAYVFYLQGVNDAGSVRASLIGCLEPVSAMVISCLWLGTPVTGFDLTGTALILVMVFLTTQRDKGQAHDRFSGTLHDTPLFTGKASLLGYYRARKATANDFNDYLALVGVAHETMAELGVNEQGGKAYPSERRVMRAIDHGEAYVVTMDAAALDARAASLAKRAGGEGGEAGNKAQAEGVGASKGALVEKAGMQAEAAPGATPVTDPHDMVEALAGTAEHERIIGIFAVGTPGDAAYAKPCGARWTTGPFRDYASLHWVCVAPDVRECGVGQFIVGEAQRIAREAGKGSLRADVYPDNKPIRALLESANFDDCGPMEIRNSIGAVRRRHAYEKTL